MGVVEGLGLLGFLAFLGLLGLFVRVHQIDRHGHVAAVAIQDLANPISVQEFLFLVRDMQGDGGAALGAGALAHGELHAVLALPAHGGRAILEAEGVDGHFVGGHEGAVKAQAEMADDAALGVALVLFEEFLGAGEGHLVDVLVHFLGSHADAVVLESQLLVFFIHGHGDAQILVGPARRHAVFGHGVAAVGHQLADENILIGIQPALDHRHDVLRMDGNIALFDFRHG